MLFIIYPGLISSVTSVITLFFLILLKFIVTFGNEFPFRQLLVKCYIILYHHNLGDSVDCLELEEKEKKCSCAIFLVVFLCSLPVICQGFFVLYLVFMFNYPVLFKL